MGGYFSRHGVTSLNKYVQGLQSMRSIGWIHAVGRQLGIEDSMATIYALSMWRILMHMYTNPPL